MLTSSYLTQIALSFIPVDLLGAKQLSTLQMVGSWNMDVSSGLGVLVYMLIDFIIILYYSEIKKYYSEVKDLIIFYRLFIIGVILSNLFHLDVFLSRIPLALESLRFVMLSFLLFYLLRKQTCIHNYILGLGIIIIFIILYFYPMYVSKSFYQYKF